MKRFDKPEDYSRDWARGVCMSVERMTGTQPRPQPSRMLPIIAAVVSWLAVIGAICVLAVKNAGGT